MCALYFADVAGPAAKRRKHGGFRNVDLWTQPLTEYFLEIIKEHFPALSGRLISLSQMIYLS